MNALTEWAERRAPAFVTTEFPIRCHCTLVQDSPSPDADLLAVCAQVGKQQDEWQRLWIAAGRPRNASRYDEEHRGETLSPEVAVLQDYTRQVWPATDDPYTTQGEVRTDTAHQLASLPALTPEGVKAKAVAVLALYDVAMLSEMRGDQWDLVLSLLRDVVGADRRLVGEAA